MTVIVGWDTFMHLCTRRDLCGTGILRKSHPYELNGDTLQ